MPIYAIGDIHGQYDMLLDALARIERDGGADAQIVFLGDLVDRGPNSPAVVEHLRAGVAEGRNWIVLKGNHDHMFCEFLDTGAAPSKPMRSGLTWLHERLGGAVTLEQYGAKSWRQAKLLQMARDNVPANHRAFLESRPLYHLHNDLLFVHAGVQPALPLEWQDENDLIWIRDEFLNFTDPHPWLVVHGHTAVDAPEHHGNRVNLDSGAGFGRPLTAAVFEGRDVWVLTSEGRAPLMP